MAMSIKASFLFKTERVSPQFLIYESDLDVSDRTAIFGEMIKMIVEKTMENEMLDIELDLDSLSQTNRSTVSLACKAYLDMIEQQRNLLKKYEKKKLKLKYLAVVREIFFQANIEVKKAWYIIAKYLGNELMSKILAQLYAEYLVGKNKKEVAKILGYENVLPEEQLTLEETKRLRTLQGGLSATWAL